MSLQGADLTYVGSISQDPVLYQAVGLREFEKVDVLNVNNGARLTTSVIYGGPGEVCLKGVAARLVQPGDRVIVVAYAQRDQNEAERIRPQIVIVNETNEIVERIS